MRPQMVQLSFLETPPTAGAASAWAALDEQQRAEVVEALARLIAKVAARNEAPACDAKEKADE